MIRAFFALVFLLSAALPANAQSNEGTPGTLSGFNGLSINLGSGSIAASTFNGWTPTFVLQDPNVTTFSTGAGYVNGEVLTLNDGCATHAVVVVQQNTSGVINQVLRTVPGSCAAAPSNPVSVLSTTGVGTGASFNLTYAPLAASLYAGASGAATNLFITDNTSPQPGLYGTEDVYIGHGAGGATTGTSSFNTFIGLNDFGIGGGAPTVINSSTGVGTDAARNIKTSGATINGIDVFGAGALKALGSTSVSGGIANLAAFGNASFGNVTAVGGSGSLAVGGGAGYGATSGLTVGNTTVVGPKSAYNATYLSNDLIIGNQIAQTALNDQDVILIGSGYTAVEPPTVTTNDYLNFNNLWTSTNINAPATANQVFYGDVTSGGGTTALATTATNGFDHIPSMAGTPSGTPAVTTAPAVVINSSAHSIDVYIGGAWYHVALTSGAG